MANLALGLMNDALENLGQYEVAQDNDLNRQDIQVYALASIAESLARIADALDAQNDNDDAAFNRELWKVN